MRIISGNLGGRQFESPYGHRTHPMSEKARGGLFNSLGDIEGLTVLDAFAGSGAISFEAISRGAKNSIAIDIDKNAIQTIQSNSKALGIDNEIKAIRANVSGWSENNPDSKFDLIICDPPYDLVSTKKVNKLKKHVKLGGLLILSWPGIAEVPVFNGLEKIKTQNYGDAQLAFYRKTE